MDESPECTCGPSPCRSHSGVTGWPKRPMLVRTAVVYLRGITLTPMSTPGVLYDVTPGVATRYPQLNQMLYSSNAGWSEFHALNLKLEKRFSSGFQILMAHTFAKSIDTDSAGSYGSPNLNPANFQLDKGPSDFDIRNRWVTSIVYELPFGRGKRMLGNINRAADLIVGGWQLNTVVSWQSGVHRSVTSTNLTGLSYVTQRADAKGVDPFTSFNGITPREDFSDATRTCTGLIPRRFPRHCR